MDRKRNGSEIYDVLMFKGTFQMEGRPFKTNFDTISAYFNVFEVSYLLRRCW